MGNELWTPSADDTRTAQEAYIRYAGGVAILNNPESTFSRSIHQREIMAKNLESITVHAEQLMYYSLQRVIVYSNPPEKRPLAKAEHAFGPALPIMRRLIDQSYEDFELRLERINPALPSLKPAPMTDESTYHNLCHGRLAKLYTYQLLDGFQVASIFGDTLRGRTLEHIQPKQKRLQSAS